MKTIQEQKFNIGELKGISAKNIEEHLKLYAGYVKHTNLIREKIEEYLKDQITNQYVIGELQRRFSFEWNGVRNHEYYFKSLEGGVKTLPENSLLKKEIEENSPLKGESGSEKVSFDKWLDSFKMVALTRGIGWAVLGWDKKTRQLVHIWIDEQHIGQLNGVEWILGIDMWEHSFIYDYATSEKKKYVDAFFENLNWEVIEENFKSVL
ncbi:MAG: Fe-Mn family superoxide dismutase [Candidatus Paceibacterota bacterium]|jgi:Fe-Mn family superoxide dismutase